MSAIHGELLARGTKKNILAIHGWASSLKSFYVLKSGLPNTVSLFAVDVPGSGRSLTPSNWSLEQVARELLSWLSEQKFAGELEILGNCSGALVALEMCRLKPHRFKRLYAIDPFAYTPFYFRLLTHNFFGPFAYNLAFASPLGRTFAEFTLKAKRGRHTELLSSFKETNHDFAQRSLQLLVSAGNYRRFQGINVPMQIIYGSRTFSAVKKSVPLWQSILSVEQVHVLPGVGHLPLEEAPEAIVKIIQC